MAKSFLHQSHPDIINRLRRTEGHPRTIITMLEEQRGCLDAAAQLHAVERAIVAAKKVSFTTTSTHAGRVERSHATRAVAVDWDARHGEFSIGSPEHLDGGMVGKIIVSAQ